MESSLKSILFCPKRFISLYTCATFSKWPFYISTSQVLKKKGSHKMKKNWPNRSRGSKPIIRGNNIPYSLFFDQVQNPSFSPQGPRHVSPYRWVFKKTCALEKVVFSIPCKVFLYDLNQWLNKSDNLCHYTRAHSVVINHPLWAVWRRINLKDIRPHFYYMSKK